MESQPNLASTGSGANLQLPPKTFLGPSSQILGAKNQRFDHFSRLPHSTPHISETKRRIDKHKCQRQSKMCHLKVNLLL